MREDVNNIDIKIGKKIREARHKRRWTLSDLAEKLGISYQLVQKYEAGTTRVPASSLFLLAQLFSLSSDYFFEDCNANSDVNINEESTLISTEKNRSLNVLVVDDDPQDLFLTRQAIEAIGEDVNIFSLHDGEQALDYLLGKKEYPTFARPDLILLDLSLPKLNGVEVLKILKKDARTSLIPVVVMSNSINKTDMLASYKQHASGYICKSFDLDIFKKNIATTLAYFSDTVVLPTVA